jgi:membrane protease YdiL (CAAX protease family)
MTAIETADRPPDIRSRKKKAETGREVAIVLAICFTLYIALSIHVLWTGVRVLTYSSERTAANLALELLIAAVAVIYLRSKQFKLRSFWPRITWDGFLIGTLLGVGLVGLMALVAWVVTMILPLTADVGVAEVRDNSALWLTILFLVINSWFEESFVVAYLSQALHDVGATRVIFLSALVRTAYHIHYGLSGALAIFLFGLVLAGAYWRTKDLSMLVVSHTVVNFIILLPDGGLPSS